MKQITCLFLIICLGNSLARYAEVPFEEIGNEGEMERLRLPRQVETVGILRGPRGVPDSDNEKYVDFGAQTGAKGSYGWYVDFPVYRQVYN